MNGIISKLHDVVDARDLIAVGGIISIAVGVAMVYVPAALIIVGAMLIGAWVWTYPAKR